MNSRLGLVSLAKQCRGSPPSTSRTALFAGVHLRRHVLDEDADSADRRGRSEVQERLWVLR